MGWLTPLVPVERLPEGLGEVELEVMGRGMGDREGIVSGPAPGSR
jgi:hypothetical protein